MQSLVNASWLKHGAKHIKLLNCASNPALALPHSEYFQLGATGFKDTQNMCKRVDTKVFETEMRKMDIHQDTTIVFYDDMYSMKSARAWWFARNCGHDPKLLKVLDGGYQTWSNFKIEMANESTNDSPYRVSEYKDERAISKDEILNGKEFTFIDTRSAQELATQPGIPGAIPFEWIRGMEKDGKFKSKIELEQIFKSIGITQDQSIVTYCKLGIRAAHVAFILENLLGFNKVRVYEGSMLEYLNV